MSAAKTEERNGLSALQNGSQFTDIPTTRDVTQDIVNGRNSSTTPVDTGVTKYASSTSYQGGLKEVEPVPKPRSDAVPVASIRKIDADEVKPSIKRPLTSRLSSRLSQKDDDDDEDDVAHSSGPSTADTKISIPSNTDNKTSTAMTKVFSVTQYFVCIFQELHAKVLLQF